jgi:drug/metabolite transporter (DMT)-like permease
MWTYFVESLQDLSALTATVLNTCSNFISTGIFGYLIFGEILTLKWFTGISIILIGISFIVSGEKKNKIE